MRVPQISRREFLFGAGLAGVGFITAGCEVPTGASEPLDLTRLQASSRAPGKLPEQVKRAASAVVHLDMGKQGHRTGLITPNMLILTDPSGLTEACGAIAISGFDRSNPKEPRAVTVPAATALMRKSTPLRHPAALTVASESLEGIQLSTEPVDRFGNPRKRAVLYNIRYQNTLDERGRHPASSDAALREPAISAGIVLGTHTESNRAIVWMGPWGYNNLDERETDLRPGSIGSPFIMGSTGDPELQGVVSADTFDENGKSRRMSPGQLSEEFGIEVENIPNDGDTIPVAIMALTDKPKMHTFAAPLVCQS